MLLLLQESADDPFGALFATRTPGSSKSRTLNPKCRTQRLEALVSGGVLGSFDGCVVETYLLCCRRRLGLGVKVYTVHKLRVEDSGSHL